MNFSAAHIVRVFGLVALLCPLAAWGHENNPSISDYDDCTRVELDFDKDGQVLTDAEKIALMDRELNNSLARFDRCKTSSSSGGGNSGTSDTSGNSDGNSGNGDSSGSGDSANANSGGVKSVPSSSVSGTESDSEEREGGEFAGGGVQSAPSPSVSGTEPDSKEAEAAHRSTQPAVSGNPSGSDNGKLPDDIPPSDNDSILEAQLRAKAEAEKDPEKRKKLWDEYRKYKNKN